MRKWWMCLWPLLVVQGLLAQEIPNDQAIVKVEYDNFVYEMVLGPQELLVPAHPEDEFAWDILPELQIIGMFSVDDNLASYTVISRLQNFYEQSLSSAELWQALFSVCLIQGKKQCVIDSLTKVENPKMAAQGHLFLTTLETDPVEQHHHLLRAIELDPSANAIMFATVYSLELAVISLNEALSALYKSEIWKSLGMNSVENAGRDFNTSTLTRLQSTLREMFGNPVHLIQLALTDKVDRLLKEWDVQVSEAMELKFYLKALSNVMVEKNLTLVQAMEDLRLDAGQERTLRKAVIEKWQQSLHFKKIKNGEYFSPTATLHIPTREEMNLNYDENFLEESWGTWLVSQINVYNLAAFVLGPKLVGAGLAALARTERGLALLSRIGIAEMSVALAQGAKIPLIPGKEGMGCWLIFQGIKETLDGHGLIAAKATVEALLKASGKDQGGLTVEEFKARVQNQVRLVLSRRP